MNYDKPILVMVASACAEVQDHIKHGEVYIDVLFEETVGAYAADE
jgi:hypothetical protein